MLAWLVYLFIMSLIAYKLRQTYLIKLGRAKCIRYHRTGCWRNFIWTYSNASAFAHQCRQLGAVFGLLIWKCNLARLSTIYLYYRIGDLDAGSDHTGFYHRLGITSSNIFYYWDEVRAYNYSEFTRQRHRSGKRHIQRHLWGVHLNGEHPVATPMLLAESRWQLLPDKQQRRTLNFFKQHMSVDQSESDCLRRLWLPVYGQRLKDELSGGVNSNHSCRWSMLTTHLLQEKIELAALVLCRWSTGIWCPICCA